MHRLYATEKKTCHNSCSGGIVIAVNPSVATGDVQKSTAQTDMSVKTWGYDGALRSRAHKKEYKMPEDIPTTIIGTLWRGFSRLQPTATRRRETMVEMAIGSA